MIGIYMELLILAFKENIVFFYIYIYIYIYVGSQFGAQAQQIWGLGPRGPETMNL